MVKTEKKGTNMTETFFSFPTYSRGGGVEKNV